MPFSNEVLLDVDDPRVGFLTAEEMLINAAAQGTVVAYNRSRSHRVAAMYSLERSPVYWGRTWCGKLVPRQCEKGYGHAWDQVRHTTHACKWCLAAKVPKWTNSPPQPQP